VPLAKQFGAPQVLVAIKNHDRNVERRSAVPKRAQAGGARH
jgi:hypothetical protein